MHYRSGFHLSDTSPSCNCVVGSATAVVGECLARCFCFFDLPPAVQRFISCQTRDASRS